MAETLTVHDVVNAPGSKGFYPGLVMEPTHTPGGYLANAIHDARVAAIAAKERVRSEDFPLIMRDRATVLANELIPDLPEPDYSRLYDTHYQRLIASTENPSLAAQQAAHLTQEQIKSHRLRAMALNNKRDLQTLRIMRAANRQVHEETDCEINPNRGILAAGEFEVSGETVLSVKLDLAKIEVSKENPKKEYAEIAEKYAVKGFGVNVDIPLSTLRHIYQLVNSTNENISKLILQKFLYEKPDLVLEAIKRQDEIKKFVTSHGWSANSDVWRYGNLIPELMSQAVENGELAAVVSPDWHTWGESKLDPVGEQIIREEFEQVSKNNNQLVNDIFPGSAKHSAALAYRMMFQEMSGPLFYIGHSTGVRAGTYLLGMLSEEQLRNTSFIGVAGAESAKGEHTRIQEILFTLLKAKIKGANQNAYWLSKEEFTRIERFLALGQAFGLMPSREGASGGLSSFTADLVTRIVGLNYFSDQPYEDDWNNVVSQALNRFKSSEMQRYVLGIHNKEVTEATTVLTWLQALVWSGKSTAVKRVAGQSLDLIEVDEYLATKKHELELASTTPNPRKLAETKTEMDSLANKKSELMDEATRVAEGFLDKLRGGSEEAAVLELIVEKCIRPHVNGTRSYDSLRERILNLEFESSPLKKGLTYLACHPWVTKGNRIGIPIEYLADYLEFTPLSDILVDQHANRAIKDERFLKDVPGSHYDYVFRLNYDPAFQYLLSRFWQLNNAMRSSDYTSTL